MKKNKCYTTEMPKSICFLLTWLKKQKTTKQTKPTNH